MLVSNFYEHDYVTMTRTHDSLMAVYYFTFDAQVSSGCFHSYVNT